MATVGEIIDICYSRNKRAQRGVDATDEELWNFLQGVMNRYFADGQRINRAWFTEEDAVSYDANYGGWLRPERAESVHQVMLGDEEVARVPFDNQGAEKWKPAVYRVHRAPSGRTGKQVYRIASSSKRKVPNALTAASQLVFHFSRRPIDVESTTQDLDPMWPEGHETLLGLELAVILAVKDGPSRAQDVADLRTGEDGLQAHARKFFEFMEHEDVGTVYPEGRPREWAPGSMRPARGG